MKMQTQGVWKINQFLVFISSLSIFVVILKFASDLLVPFLISIAIAIVLNPLLVYLQRKHIPKVISMSIVIVLSLLPVVIMAEQITIEIKSLSHNFHNITQDFTHTLEQSTDSLSQYGISFDQTTITKAIEKSNLTDIVKHLASQASSQFSNIFLIIFTAAFMLM